MYICLNIAIEKLVIPETPLLKLGYQSQTKNLTIPFLSIGSKYELRNSEHLKGMATKVKTEDSFFAQTEITFRSTMILKPVFQARSSSCRI